MVSEQKIQQAVKRIIQITRPSKVILFGSYARGEASENSDLDLLIIEPEVSDRLGEMARLRAAIGQFGTGVDVLVYSEAEVSERASWCTSPIYWALREGRVLYEAN